MISKKLKFDLSSSFLHIFAMTCMFCDHLWATAATGNQWLTWVGRLAFPIFAFMTVEGYFHTQNLKKYVIRMVIFAVVSEIPFNLMLSDSLIDPFHQNVIWTLLMGIGAIDLSEKAKKIKRRWLQILAGVGIALGSLLIGTIAMVDYGGVGVVTVLIFYYFRGRKWWCLLGQIVAMYYLNVEALGGMELPVTIFGKEIFISQQGTALWALIPIWLYRGRKGISGKPFQYICYGFYPVHMVILFAITKLMA